MCRECEKGRLCGLTRCLVSYEEGPSTATDDQAMVFKLRSSAIAPSGHILERERLEKDLARANERARPQTDRREPVIAELLDGLRDARRMLEAGATEGP